MSDTNWFDDRISQQSAVIAAQDARERAMQEANKRELAIAWQRLKAILQGERPTRETNADWHARRSGMLPQMPAAIPPANSLHLLIDGAPRPNREFPGMLPPPVGGVRG